jgi:hypothetical protein
MFMPESTQTVGLCSTCNNSPTCFHRARRGPALLCELFDDYVAPSLRNGGRAASPTGFGGVGFREVGEQASKHSGLCVNCEHRGSCWHAKPAGGVWHCESYE